jgi:hypothetical protein
VNNVLCNVSAGSQEVNAVRLTTSNDLSGMHGCFELDGFIQVKIGIYAIRKGKTGQSINQAQPAE